MITRAALEERVREWGLREDVVEKDYVLGWVLWGIGSDTHLSDTWVFKGGTCLKKCYIETYRFSEDLDFTILPGGAIQEKDLRPIVEEVLKRVSDESGINFSERQPLFKSHPSGMYTEGRIYYHGPRNAPTVASIKLDLSASEQVVRPTVLRGIAHSFSDNLPEPATVRCYAFEEVFAEKTRAMGERSRPRDLYDIINLFRRLDLRGTPDIIRDVLTEKCQTKGVAIPTFQSIASSLARAELESEWGNMLAHQLPMLPPFESFWAELPNLFAWLEGSFEGEELPSAPALASEKLITEWAPPPTVMTWGVGVPLEAVRFAGANHLCIRLGYGGSTRVVEPYSLRRTSEGYLLLHAIKVDTREHRSYRVDRIESIELTNRPFTPTYQVEFSGSGPILALPTTTTPRATVSSSRRRRHSSGTGYTVQCPYCQKRFRRERYSTRLNPHKDKQGYPCPGRTGYIV